MSNMKFYNDVRQPPKDALKNFSNGTFSGTDINTMWRIKVLTDRFGMCGIGWYYTIDKQWLEQSGDSMMAMSNISLYIKDDEWSKPIAGTGGNKFSYKVKATDKREAYMKVSDECYKMSATDALGNACKSLGLGANIYWQNDKTKYTEGGKSEEQEEQEDKEIKKLEEESFAVALKLGVKAEDVPNVYQTKYEKKFYDASSADLKKFIAAMQKKVDGKK